MYNEIDLRIEGLEQLGVSADSSADLVSLMRALAEMTVTDDIHRLYSLIDYSDFLLRCIKIDCLSRLHCEEE